MSRKHKNMLRISIALNLLFIVLFAWGVIRNNFVKEQVIVTEVQHNLVLLEGLIAHQIDNGWAEPQLVTTKLGEIQHGILFSIQTANQLGNLSKGERRILETLHSKLWSYPVNQEYRFAEVTDEDQRNFEDLRNTLREAGLGFNITIPGNLKYFLKQAEQLNETIPYPR